MKGLRQLRVAALSLALGVGPSACMDKLPDQDRRILATAPIAKMSAEDLWKEYQSDKASADRKYRGQAVEISGKVTATDNDGSTSRYVLFGQTPQFGIRGNLLEDRAADILKSATAGERLTLRCFCEGLDGHVVLKSCIQPE